VLHLTHAIYCPASHPPRVHHAPGTSTTPLDGRELSSQPPHDSLTRTFWLQSGMPSPVLLRMPTSAVARGSPMVSSRLARTASITVPSCSPVSPLQLESKLQPAEPEHADQLTGAC
jgi:hypothetical protein